jgi:GntR family transcriptional regulator
MARETLDARDLSLYRQVETILREKIADGELRPGGRVPAEAALSAEYGVSRDTVRQALDALERDNLIDRQVGRGTFVRVGAIAAGEAPGRRQQSWHEAIAFADQAREIVSQSAVPAPPHVARILGVEPTEPVPFMIRMSEDEPRWGVKRYVHPRFAHLLAEIAAAPVFTTALAARAGAEVAPGRLWVEAIQAEPRFARLFDLPPGSPLLSIWWIDEAAGAAVACTQMLQPGTRFSIGFSL